MISLYTAGDIPPLTPRMSLSGDTDELRLALGVLVSAGMLRPNRLADGWHWNVSERQQVFDSRWIQRTAPCPRCSRPTAVTADHPASVCTGCRAEHLASAAPELAAWNAVVLGRARGLTSLLGSEDFFSGDPSQRKHGRVSDAIIRWL